MQTRTLGGSQLEISAIGLGGMPLSIQNHPDRATGVKVIHAALDAGMTLIDTADAYCLDDSDIGANERLIALALREWRGGSAGAGGSVVVATKGGLERPGGSWATNGRPEHLERACERSLKALGVEAIELYQLHAPDSKVPWEDSVGAMARLRQAGKIRHVGLSNVNVDEIERARRIVDVASVQNRLNPFDTTSFANGTVAHCARVGITFLAHSPVGGHRGHTRLVDDPTLAAVGKRHGVSPYQVCLAWLLTLTPVMVPIPGASKVTSATSSAAAGALVLTADDLAELGRAFPAVRLSS